MQETRTEDKPGEDISDVGWSAEIAFEHRVGGEEVQMLCTLAE